MPDIRDYNLNRWGFVDDSGTLITIASSNVSIDELNSILGTINIVPNDDNYVLMVNGREAGVISITSQLKLKNVVYNPDTQSIEFTFDSDEGEKKVSVDVHELVDVYTAGQGLGVDKNQFFIKIDPSSEKYLSVSENGIKISGLDTLLKNLNETLANFGQETAKAFDQINNVLETSINTINGGIDNEIRPAITKNEESITALQEKVDGIVVPTKVSELENDAQYQNADEVDAKISAHIQEAEDKFATKDELTEETNARTVKDTQLQNDLQLEAETARAAEKANADAISAINEVLPTKVEYTDVATSENPGRKAIILKNHDVILGTTTTGQTNSLVMLSKWDKADFGSASVTLNLNGKDEHPTYNDNKEMAFVDDIPSVEGFVTKEIADETYQPKGDYATLEALNAEITTRSEANTELQSDITAEATARIQKDNEIEASLQNKADKADLDTINLVKKEDLVYELQVGDRVAGSINLPEDQFLKGVDYNSDTKVITFTFETTDGEVISQVNISDLVDTYVAGNGLNLTSNEFSIKIDATTQQYVEVSAEGLKIINIDEKLAEKVGLVDIATEENPNRKAIVLNNHDTLLGNTTSGSAVNIAMVSKWDKVDLGSTQVSINLNGKDERPTYNDDAELALLSDVQAITVPTKVSELENDSLYQTKDEVDAAIATKAEQTEVEEIKADLEQFKAPYEINLNALNSAGDADSEAISTAIGGIDNLRAVISENRSIIGDINNGTVPVSIRILGNITTVYYVLDSLAGYTLNEINIQNTSGTLAKNSVTHSVMSEEMVVDNLTSDESTLPLSAKQGKVLDEKIQKKGMYYQGVKVDTQKLFALTKESTEDDIKAALQLETSSGSYTLPTAEILDDCLGKGYQLLSNWMPVSVAWNEAAYVLYIVGQNYMMQPTGLYTVSIKITDGVYSVFQAAKVEEFAIISKINTQIESLYQTVNDLKSNIPILSAKVELLESKVDNLEKSNSEVVETYDGSQELNDKAKVYSISNANITNSPSITAKSVILNDSTLTNNARMQIKAENVNINNLQVTGDFPKSTSNSVININDTENIIFKDMTFNSSNVYNGIEIGLSSDNSKLPKNIIFDNCRFEGSFSNNAILIFGTQNNATITLNNCYFEKVSNALRLSNKSNASGVTVNIINCTVDEWDSNTLWSGFLICEDYTNTESEAQAEEANLFSPEKIKVNFINLIHNSEKILPSDIVSVCGSKDENQVVVVCIDAIQGSDYCINYDANKFPTITFE